MMCGLQQDRGKTASGLALFAGLVCSWLGEMADLLGLFLLLRNQF